MEASLYLLAGIFIFFILEKFILWRHHTLVSLIPVAARRLDLRLWKRCF